MIYATITRVHTFTKKEQLDKIHLVKRSQHDNAVHFLTRKRFNQNIRYSESFVTWPTNCVSLARMCCSYKLRK